MQDENEEVYLSDVATEETDVDDTTDEEMGLLAEDALDRLDAEIEAGSRDYLVRCNSCGFVRHRSDPSPCPNGDHGRSGWSYAGPIPDTQPEPEFTPDEVAYAHELAGVPTDGQPTGFDEAAIDAAVEAAIDEEDEPEVAASDAHAERSTGFRWALEQIITVNQQAIDQKARVKEAQATLKDEKETLESIQDELNRLIQEAARIELRDEPDPDRYPLYDRPKAEINATFAKPEAIPPLPPYTFEEFARRKARDTRLESIGIWKGPVKALAEAGYHTVADIGKLTEASAPLTSVKGVGVSGANNITERLADFAQGLVDGWAELHPEPVAESEVAG